MELSPQGASRSGEAEPALPGRPVQREMRRQAAARMWRCRSAVNASRGVRQFRHVSGRSLSMAIDFIYLNVMFFLDLYRAVVSIPRKLDELKKD